MNKIQKKGVSLIVLVITIIVIIILAGAVILSLSSNNPINTANKATFINDIGNFQTELEFYKGSEFVAKMGSYDATLLQADSSSVTYNGVVNNTKTIKDLVPALAKTPKYDGLFQILDGKLVYGGHETVKQDWAKEIGVEVVIVGEPRIIIVPPAATTVLQGSDVVYTIKVSSTLALTTINLTGKVEVLNNAGVPLSVQPTIIIGTVSGTSSDTVRQVTVTIKTDTIPSGIYDLKIKTGAATDSNNMTNTQNIISVIGFELVDVIPPVNPTMSASIATWTNGNVAVTINYSTDSAVKQYSTDGTIWNPYTVPVVVATNATTVYAKGSDISGNESGVATLTVANIDKIVPTITASNGGATTSSVTVTAVASDTGGSAINALSYQYSKDNGVTWTAVTSATSYTFSSITTGTYQCKVKVADNATNSITSNAVAIATTGLGTITLAALPAGWTNGNVTVTVTYPAEIITKQYSTDGTTWNPYTAPVVITANSTTVYAKGTDAGGNQTIQSTLTVANIDKTVPVVTASNGGATTSSVTVTAVASDAGGSALNSSSYQYSKDNGTTWTAVTSATSYTFSAITSGTYQCKVKVADNATNSITSSAVAIATTGLGTITLVASPTGWTNGNVTVTISYPTEVVTKQYSTDGSTWNAYTAPVVVTVNNTTVYAKGLDAGGNQTVQSTLTVANIDKILPTVAFGTNGNATYAKSRSTTVTASDNASINASSLEYQWTTSSTAPTEASFTTSFTNGGTITSPAGVTGNYYLWILAKDTFGNTTIVSSNIFSLDNTIPIITMVGSSPAGVTVGSAYIDEGATASDNASGNLTSSIQVVSNVNISVKGSYTVTYNVTDSSGNAATQVVRTVTVMDVVSTYNFTSGSQTFVVPVTGTYIINAVGAAGGYTGYNAIGKGALVEGTFALIQGQSISIVIGGKGGDGGWPAGGGGGGGTYIYNNTTGTILLVAGGGGGTSTSSSGGDGSVAAAGTGNGGGAITANGSMGGTGGGGGGGYLTSGARALNGGYGGGGFLQGSAAGSPGSGGGVGGFGGGGGGGVSCNWSSNYGGGGAGGGYTGGYGGGCTSGGGGGTSYINPSATNISSVAGLSSGNGSTSITFTGSASRSFAYRGISQTFTVPTTGTYKISVDGASGGTCGYSTPGNGAHVEGEFNLTKNQVINIIVGGQGGNVSAGSGSAGGGGGGGSFVYNNTLGKLLLVAGAGGGGSTSSGGGAGTIGAIGTGYGGTAMNNTESMGGNGGGGGGGYLTSGATALSGGGGGGGYAQGSGAGSAAGGAGGFGGGGGGGSWNAWSSNYGGGGAGGGYTGGNGGYCIYGGSGGTSYIDASVVNPVSASGTNVGNGYITINLIR
jgi:hypothetical protein